MEGDILGLGECEIILKTLRNVPLDEVGSKAWKRQHEYINRLNQQAQLNAQHTQIDFVSEQFADTGNINILIVELLTCELWREKVVPIIVKTSDFQPHSTIPFYLSLYNEAVILNLLETICFSVDVVETLGDLSVDLVDFCYRTLSKLYALHQLQRSSPAKNEYAQTPEDVFENFKSTLMVEFGAKCISIMRYISEAGDKLPLDCHTRMIKKLNVPQLLVALLEDGCGWIKSDAFYQSGSWHPKTDPLSPHEINLFLLLRQLILSEEMSSYDFHQQNINSLMRLQKFLSPNVLQFCSPLNDLSQALSQIQVKPPEQVKPYGLLIELEPDQRAKIEDKFKGKYGGIAKRAMTTWANPSQQEMEKEAKSLLKTWQINNLEQLMNQVPKCEVCGAEAVSRCSQCKQIWYCRRQCQVENWTEHKNICALLRNK